MGRRDSSGLLLEPKEKPKEKGEKDRKHKPHRQITNLSPSTRRPVSTRSTSLPPPVTWVFSPTTFPPSRLSAQVLLRLSRTLVPRPRSGSVSRTGIMSCNMSSFLVSAGFATVHANNSLTVNAVEAYPLDQFSSEVRSYHCR